MAEVLIVYSPGEEHIAVVAHQLRSSLEQNGHEVHTCPVEDAPTAPMGYDLVLIGVPLLPVQSHDDLVRWVRGNLEQLGRRGTSYVEVVMSSEPQAPSFAGELTQRTGWRPDRRWTCRGYDDVERCGAEESRRLDTAVRAGSA